MGGECVSRLVKILEEELADCFVLYGPGRATEGEIRNMAFAWAKTLADVFGFAGDEEILREGFLRHKQNENFFPKPCHIRPGLLHKKPGREMKREQALPADPALPWHVCEALKGNQQSEKWIYTFLGEQNGKDA